MKLGFENFNLNASKIRQQKKAQVIELYNLGYDLKKINLKLKIPIRTMYRYLKEESYTSYKLGVIRRNLVRAKKKRKRAKTIIALYERNKLISRSLKISYENCCRIKSGKYFLYQPKTLKKLKITKKKISLIRRFFLLRSEIAKKFGVHPDTISWYRRKGLKWPKSDMIRFERALKSKGINLDDRTEKAI